ncbi:MAG: hypothetical protein ACXVWU_08135 [Nocardioides sp.]
MLVLGLILIVVAALVLLAVIVGGANDPALIAFGSLKWDTSATWMFVAGALTLLVLIVGLDLLRTGLRRAHQRRKDSKELGRLSKKVRQQEEEKRRLQAERDAAAAHDTTTTGTTTTGTTTTDTVADGTVADDGTAHGNHRNDV